jgi:hypothetical protein
MKVKLDFGILLNDFDIPLWKYQVLDKLIDFDYSEIKLIIIDSTSDTSSDNIVSLFLYKIHCLLDRIIFCSKTDYARKKNTSNRLKNIPRLAVYPALKDGIKLVGAEDCTRLQLFNLDVILVLSSKVLKGTISPIAKYGIWHFGFAYNCSVRDHYDGYWEVISEQAETSTYLTVAGKTEENDIVLSRAHGSTCAYSITINRNYAYNRAKLMIPRILKGIYFYDNIYLNSFIMIHDKQEEYVIKHINLTAYAAFKNIFRHLGIIVKKVLKKMIYSDAFNWYVLTKLNKPGESTLPLSLNDFKRLLSPKDRFWADPFVIHNNNKYFIFVEEYIYKTSKGHISVLELNEKAELENYEAVIKKPYHMSFPFILNLNENFYMIPDTGDNRTIELYKCTQFPDKWDFVMNLMENADARDTVLFYYSNKWWMFTSINESDNKDDYYELFLYYSTDLFSTNWISHPYNPIVTDVKTARSAGSIIFHEGKIYRPSQDCSERYGKSIGLNCIITLDENKYIELAEYTYEPNKNSKIKGMHTINSNHNLTVLDEYSYRKRLSFRKR